MTVNTEQFCRRFLLDDGNYKHLHNIIAEYRDRFLRIELDFNSREDFMRGFSSICYDILRTRGHGRGYILSILGFASHVNTQYRNMDWYDRETLIVTLVVILTSINFKPSDYCMKHYYCIIL